MPKSFARHKTEARRVLEETCGRKIAVSVEKIRAHICRHSYYDFVQYFWDVICPEKPVWNWHIEYLCQEIQDVAERVFASEPKEYDLVCNISPGTTKSTVFSIMFQPWTWTRMRHAKHITGTHTASLGLDLSQKSRDLVKSEKYREAYPDIKVREDLDTKSYWGNTFGGWRFSCTVGGKAPMGMHAHFLGVDDPIDPQKAQSDVEINAANYWMNNVIPTRVVDKLIAPTMLVMQRLHQNDPTADMLRARLTPTRQICLPAEETEDIRPRHLHRKYHLGLMDPVRLSRKALAPHQSKGDYYYSSQFLQNPVPRSGGMFKVIRLKFTSDIPPRTEFRNICRYWDKAATEGGGAYTVGWKMGETKTGRFYVLDIVRGQWDTNEREEMILLTAKLDGQDVIVGLEQEPGSGGKESADSTAQRLKGYMVRINRPTGSQSTKVIRADAFSVQVNAGSIYVKEAAWNEAMVDEMKYFPFSTYKDQIDAGSGCFTVLTTGIVLCTTY